MDSAKQRRPVGVILAGGGATRLGGGDKVLMTVAGKPLLVWLIERLAPQCAALVLNANGDPARFSRFGCPVVADDPRDHGKGPLAGILAGLDAVAARFPAADDVLTVAGDTPFVPRDLACRLMAARVDGAPPVAAARSGGRRHPVAALWRLDARDPLRRLVREEGCRRVGDAVERVGVTWIDWPAEPADPFHNINTWEDLDVAAGAAAAAD